MVKSGYGWLRLVVGGYGWIRVATSGYEWLRGLQGLQGLLGLWEVMSGGEGSGIKIFSSIELNDLMIYMICRFKMKDRTSVQHLSRDDLVCTDTNTSEDYP